MNEDLKKSPFLNAPALILGIGIIAPLYAGGALPINALLGIIAVLLISISNALLAALRPRTAKNGRIGIAVLVTGGLLTIAKVALSAAPLTASVPAEALAPLMLIVAVFASMTDAYEVKKKFMLALFDGAATGLSFLLLLCVAGILRDLLGNNTFINPPAIHGFRPLHIFILVPGVFLFVAFFAWLLPKKKRGAA